MENPYYKEIDKMIPLLNFYVYDTVNDKCGVLSSIGIMNLSFAYLLFYDVFIGMNIRCIIAKEDFIKDKMKFVLLSFPDSKIINDDGISKRIDAIKNYFGNDFKEDMLMYMDYKEWHERVNKDDTKGCCNDE